MTPAIPGTGQPEAPAAARIAVVDDSAVVRAAVTRQLTAIGYEVLPFEGGAAFVAWLETDRCDALLLDSQMPGMSGPQVLQTVRKRFNREELPILFVTADSNSQHVVEALTNGANDFIIKPFDSAVLAARLGLQVTLRRSQEQLRKSFAAQAMIQAELERRAEVALAELKLAAELQSSISRLAQPPGFLSASCQVRPSSHVSGDVLCSRITADGRFLLFLGDATGHGVTAALLTMLVVALLNSMDGPEATPRSILNHLNGQLAGYHLDGKFVSGIAITVAPDGTFSMANAGHPPGVLVGAAMPAARLLESSGPPLGWFGELEYQEETVRLSPGDVVVLYTDGLVECENRAGVEFGTHAVVRIAQQRREEAPAAIAATLLAEASHHALESLNADDVSIAVIRFGAEASDSGSSQPAEARQGPAA
jgi:sigma-B regulation protein RsbU (phosphoserine phosphatase)